MTQRFKLDFKRWPAESISSVNANPKVADFSEISVPGKDSIVSLAFVFPGMKRVFGCGLRRSTRGFVRELQIESRK